MATSKIHMRGLTPFNLYSLVRFYRPVTLDILEGDLIVD